jgi:hypothetical protein
MAESRLDGTMKRLLEAELGLPNSWILYALLHLTRLRRRLDHAANAASSMTSAGDTSDIRCKVI